MSDEQPQEASSASTPTLDELLLQLEVLKQSDNIPAYISLLEHRLQLLSRGNDPMTRAALQFTLGNALQQYQEGDRTHQLRQAIFYYDAALTVYTCEGMPTAWARIQCSKGVALHELAGLLRDSEREKMLRAAIACFVEIPARVSRQLVPAIRVAVQNNRGGFLRELAGLLTGSERAKVLQEALDYLNEALQEKYREIAPTTWAAAQSNKGSTLRDLADLLIDPEQQIEMVYTAIACYDAALIVYNSEEASNDWAAIQNNKGAALGYLSRLITGEEQRETLRKALICYDAALTVYTHEVAPVHWTITQNNRGIALFNSSRLLVGVERAEKLQEAIASFNAVLLEWHREKTPIDWARTQHNKGKALCDLATLFVDTERAKTLQEAITCFDKALLERDSKVAPDEWAKTQNNKGIALRDLAGLLRGAGRAGALRAAISCFDAVLQKRSREEAPTDWAMAQNNKSATLRDLAAILGQVGTEQALTLRVKLLRAAIVCCNEALTIYTRKDEPLKWAAIQNNMGNALRELAEGLTDREQKTMLQAALVCYNAALLEQSREISPIDWAMVQNNKGMALRNLVGIVEGDERAEKLRESMVCYDAVLSVYTRQVLPADHHRIAQSVGIFLFKEGDWKNAARYLATALDALDDLYILEITAYGRKAALKAGGDLAAHLAYALLRTGKVHAARQAAEALERGRARATGEVITRQEAQLAVARQLVPELLERFRESSNQLVKISLVSGRPEMSQAAHPPDKMSVVGEAAERTALIVLNMQLADYEEARAARTAYDEVIALIRQEIPDFLHPGEIFEAIVKELKSDEYLTYVATTPVGAVALFMSGSDAAPRQPVVKGWWDEQLTSSQVAQLLVGSSSADGKLQHGDGGLLAVSSHRRRIRRVLDITMQTLGAPDGVLAALALHCRAVHVRRLVLIPCGLLGLLPLHAAMVPCSSDGTTTEPLIDVVQVCYAPSVHIWAVGRRRGGSLHSVQLEALVVGDPQPQPEETPPLPGAKDEAAAISTLISQTLQGRVSTYIGEAATLSNVVDMLRGQHSTLTHVHFACHGVAELSKPLTSGVLLAYGTRLAVYDVLDPAIALLEQLRLVVLSACRTALVGTELPDEAVGLPSAWLQVGAKNVLASLWPVSDKITLVFMTKFYELHLLDGLEPTEALWLTQRWLRGLPTWREDFRAMGAKRAAAGAEANEVVGVLASTRGAKALTDDAERAANEKEDESMEWEKLDEESVTRNHDTIKLPGRWTDPYHWAAFAIYGA